MAEGEEEKIVAGDGEEKGIVLAGADNGNGIVLAGASGADKGKGIVLVGAGDEEKEKTGAAGVGGNLEVGVDYRLFRPPPGFRFTPGDDELVIYYLLPKLQGQGYVPNHNIIEDNVYQSHPDVLIEKYRKRGVGSWYFLSPRARKYLNGKRPSRSTEDKRGRWKASTGTSVNSVKMAGDGKTVYSESVLGYYNAPIKGETKTKWLMQEITIPGYKNEKRGNNAGGDGSKDVLDQYVMCRIYVTPRRQWEEEDDVDEAGPSETLSQPPWPAKLSEKQAGKKQASKKPAESGQAGVAAGSAQLSEKQAGKRPAEEQQLGDATATAPKRAHYPNPDHLHLGPPAPLHAGDGMQGPYMTPEYCGGGGPGMPMGYYARGPMPRPPMLYNNGHAPVPYNGQVHVLRHQMAYNGQAVQLPRQQVPYNGQGTLPRQTAGFNGQVPMPRQQAMLALTPPYLPGDSYGQIQNQAMMRRRPCPAAQAVNPPPSVVPRSAQTQKQPAPSSVVPRPAQTQTQTQPRTEQMRGLPSSVVPGPGQTQKLPETEEMRANRVVQQNLQEFQRITQRATPPSAGAAFAAHQQRPMMPFTHQQQQQQRQMMQFTQQQQQQQRRMMPFPHQQEQQHQQRQMMQFMQQQQQQQLPCNFGPNANYYHHAGASVDNFNASEAAQHYHLNRVIPSAMSSSAGASAEGLGSSVVTGAGGEVNGINGDSSIDDNLEFVESGTAGGRA